MNLAEAISLYSYGTSDGAVKGWEFRLSGYGYKLDKNGTSRGSLYRAPGGHSVHVADGGFIYENSGTGAEKSGDLENLPKVLDQIHKDG